MRKVMTFMLLAVSVCMVAQQPVCTHQRRVVSSKQQYQTGKVNETKQVIDSFFYGNGAVKEVAESIIRYEQFRIMDSLPINRRQVWDSAGRLLLTEDFDGGKITKVISNYPNDMNIIGNGSFEKHSPIPCHTVTKDFRFDETLFNVRIRHEEIVNRVITATDTSVFVLVTDTLIRNNLQANDEPFEKWCQQYVIIKKNSVTVDSIFNHRRFICKYMREGSGEWPRDHLCNYDDETVTVDNWASIGRKHPNVFDLGTEAPHRVLKGIAHRVFSFEPISGPSFVKLSAFSPYYGLSCNPFLSHPFLQTKLNTTLGKGESYCLEFWIWKSKIYPEDQRLQVCFSQEPVTKNNFGDYLSPALGVAAFNDTVVNGWSKATVCFEAPENARYMTVGFFDFGEYTKPVSSIADRWCYVDGFVLAREANKGSVHPDFHLSNAPRSNSVVVTSQADSLTALVFDGKAITSNQIVTLEDIRFDTNGFVLDDKSKQHLTGLVAFMVDHPLI